jgi:hypothetical protein
MADPRGKRHLANRCRPTECRLKALGSGNETILLVDDDGVLLEMIPEMLEGLGYHVVSRSNSMEARQAFTTNPDRFDLIITDQTMPPLRARAKPSRYMRHPGGAEKTGLKTGEVRLCLPADAR